MADWFYNWNDDFYLVCMATQIGILKMRGPVGGICFYVRDGIFYARQKSSLTRQRVKSDPAFSETMRYARRMGKASATSFLYKATVPKKERCRERYREIVSAVLKELATL